MDKSKEDFEAWFRPREIAMKSQGLGLISISRLRSKQWEAWQASRVAIELDIDWPEANDDFYKEGEEGVYAMGHEDGKDKVVIAVSQALKSAGITLKGEKP